MVQISNTISIIYGRIPCFGENVCRLCTFLPRYAFSDTISVADIMQIVYLPVDSYYLGNQKMCLRSVTIEKWYGNL